MRSAKQPEVRLRHILDQIDGVADAIAGRRRDEIATSFLFLRAIERAVQIISEAAKELPAELRDEYPEADWKPIIRIGNLLRHEYYRIDPHDMWEIATHHLPRLRPIVEAMLATLPRQSGGTSGAPGS